MGSLYFLSPLLMYFPRFLPEVETQPLVAFGIAIVTLMYLRRGQLLLLMLFSLAVFLVTGALAAAAREASFSSASLFGVLNLLWGPAFLFGAVALRGSPPKRNVLACIVVFYALLAVLEIALPDVYRALAEALLDRGTVFDGHHGISLLTPEPTYALLSLIYLLFLTIWSSELERPAHRWVEWLIVVLIALTFSTYLLAFLVAYFLLKLPKSSMLIAACLLFVPSFIDPAMIDPESSVRWVVAVSNLLAIDLSDVMLSLTLLDPSLATRASIDLASFTTPLYAPFGLGLSCDSVPAIFGLRQDWYVYSNPVLVAAMGSGCLTPQAYLPALFLALGWMAPLVAGGIALAFWRAASGVRRPAVWIVPLAFAMVMLIVQCQVSSPVPWLMIFMAFVPAEAIRALGVRQHIEPAIRSAFQPSTT